METFRWKLELWYKIISFNIIVYIYSRTIKIKKMEAQLWKICPACSDVAVEGCESMTEAQVEEWMSANNEILETAAECGDNVKYIYIPVSQSH